MRNLLTILTFSFVFLVNQVHAMDSKSSIFTQIAKLKNINFEKTADDYNTQLVFTGKNGSYFTDVDVKIFDRHGSSVISSNVDSTYLLTDLAPGYYTVKASVNGHERVKKIFVEHSLKTFYFKFPQKNNIQVLANNV